METLEPVVIEAAIIDSSEDVRIAAMDSLGTFADGGKDVSAYLAKAFKDDSEDVRDAAFAAMEAISDRKTVLNLMEYGLDSPYADARVNAIKSLINIDSTKDEARKMLVKALADGDEDVRYWALATADFIWDKDFASEQDALSFIRK